MSTQPTAIIERSVRKRPTEWVAGPTPEVLTFEVGGRNLVSLPLRAVTLCTPFSELTDDTKATEPSWESIPPHVQAAVVPAQPLAADPGRVRFLPRSIRYSASYSDHYFVDLSGTFNQYLNKLSQNSRHNLRRRVRRFVEFSGGQIKWGRYRSIEEVGEFYRLAAAVSDRSWAQAAGGPGFSGTLGKERMREVAGEGRARGYVLFDAERPVSFAYCEIRDDDVAYVKIGYDQGYSQWSPGTVLYYLLLESLFAEGRFRCFDFQEGELWYKRALATGSKRCARIIYFRRALRSFALVTAHCLLGAASRGAGRVLGPMSLKRRIKRAMMGKLRRPGQDI
jgi:hypothetical protein